MKTVSVAFNDLQEFSKKLGEPKWLLDYRIKNAKIFEQRPLKKSPYLNLAKLQELLKKPQNNKAALPKELEQKGIKVFSWGQALKEIPQKIKEALKKEHSPKDQFEAFINAWFNTGFVIVVGRKVQKKEPIAFESVFQSEAVGKVVVVVESNSKDLKFIERLKGKERLLLNETILLGAASKAFFLRVHQNAKDCQALLFQQTVLEKDTELLNSNAWLGGSLLRSNTFNNLVGQGAKLTHLDFLLLSNNQLFDINNTAVHTATDSESFTEMKSVLAQQSKSVFDAMIKILPSGQRTNALLEAHSMLLSEGASSNNIPALEIEADDVRATHSASVAQILEEQIFYLESRGIKKNIAKQLIVTSFLESIIFKMPKEFHAELFSLVEKKMAKLSKDESNA